MKNYIIILGSYLLVFSGVYGQTIGDYRTKAFTYDNGATIYIFQKFDTSSLSKTFFSSAITDISINITSVKNILITYNITVSKITVYETLDINIED